MSGNKMQRQLPIENRETRSSIINAVTNKIIAPNNAGVGNKSRVPTQPELAPIVQSKINDIHIAEQIFDVIPDMEQAAEIAVASVLSTKDLMTTTVNFDADSKGLSVELRDRMLKHVSRYFRKEYRIQDSLYDIVNDTMFMTGSYPLAILPESSVDRIINGYEFGKVSTESLDDGEFKSLGILGSMNGERDNTKIGVEALALDQGDINENKLSVGEATISITDNPNVVKLPRLQELQTRHKIMEKYNSGPLADLLGADDEDDTEGFKVGVESLHINRGMYKNPTYASRTVEEIHSADDAPRPSVGHPLVMRFPSESVIPVHVPGNLKHHVGYLVVLDNLGNPVSKEELTNANISFDKDLYSTEDKATAGFVQSLNPSYLEPGQKNKRVEYTKAEITKMFTDIVEGKLMNALKNGTYGENAMLTTPSDVYRIMMARALAKKSTQILFIPAEQMTYFAINYNEYGQGKSILDRGRMLSTIRTALAFSTMRASILNSTENREYTIELDEDDLEPEQTIAKAESRIRQGFNGDVPYTGGPHDVLSYMGNAGISLNIVGNENYPSTKITVDDNSPDYKIPDTDLDDQYARRMYRMMGVDPDLVLSPENIEFASQIVTKDLFTSRRIAKLQEVFSRGITNFVQSYIFSDGFLISELIEIIKTTFEEAGSEKKISKAEMAQLLRRFVAQLTATLPPPDTGGISSMLEQFNDVKDAIDEYLEVIITDEAIGDMDTEVSVDDVRMHIRNSYLRSWIKRNNVDDDLLRLFDDKEQVTEYIRGLAKENKDLAELIARVSKNITKRLATVEKNHGEGTEVEDDELPDTQGDPEPEIEEPETLDPEAEADPEATDDLDADPEAEVDADADADAEVVDADAEVDPDAVADDIVADEPTDGEAAPDEDAVDVIDLP